MNQSNWNAPTVWRLYECFSQAYTLSTLEQKGQRKGDVLFKTEEMGDKQHFGMYLY